MTDIFCASIKTNDEGRDTITISFKGYRYIINCIFPDDADSTTPPYTPPTSVNRLNAIPLASVVPPTLPSLVHDNTLPSPPYDIVNSPPALASDFGTSPNNSPTEKNPPSSITAASMDTDMSMINQHLFYQFFKLFDTEFRQHAQDFHQYFREAQTAAVNTPHLLCLQSLLSTLMNLYKRMSEWVFFICIYI
ncbi:hypothetical protein O181_106412 [Austropuccinia psidii MF-1]|uniref:Uncharacterized protein n=1 Tax=Austropuccinia psidii MF-1 TaxID=1389203 RepID=A0A9Q3JQD9_9BASI|nr:hypothetical protein [Austropuccinia psidii MF-1]